MQVATPQHDHHATSSANKWALPEEFSKVRLTSISDHARRPEVEPAVEPKIDYTATPLKPAKPLKDTAKTDDFAQRPSIFANVELRKSARKLETAKPTADPHSLPEEFATIHSKLKHAEKPEDGNHTNEVEVLAEKTPDYLAVPLKASPTRKPHEKVKRPSLLESVQLKSSSHGDTPRHRPEVEVAAAEKPNYLAVPLKAASPPNTSSRDQPRRSSWLETVSLKSSGHGEIVQKPLEEDPHRPSLAKELSQVKLQTKPRPPEVELLPEIKPDYRSVKLKKATKPRPPPMDDGGRPSLTKELSTVKLKTVPDTLRQPEVEVPKEEPPDYSSVQLKATTPILKDEKTETRRASYTEIPLKDTSATSRKAEVEVLPEVPPDYSVVKLKPAPPIEKATPAPRRASFAEVPLKKTEPLVKEGDDKSPAFTAPLLKESDHGKIIKNGGDVKKGSLRNDSTHALPKEFDAVHLKTPIPKEPEVEVFTEELPVYTDLVALKKTEPIIPPTTPRRASYTDVPLHPTPQGDAIQHGQDVAGQYVPHHFVLPEEFEVAHQKLKKPVERAPEI